MVRSVLPSLLLILFVGGVLPAGAQGDAGTAGTIPDGWAGKPTASGEVYNPDKFTATGALRIGLRIAVTNPANGRTVTVRIIDNRTPGGGRLLDLSRAAARALDFPETGGIPVDVRPLKAEEPDVVKLPALEPKVEPKPEPAPGPAAETPPPVQTELPPPPQAYFQLGAFRTEWNVQSLARSLMRKGYAPLVFHDGGLYRVYLQAKESDAAALSDKLTREGRVGFFQVSRAPSGTPVPLSTE